MNLTYVQRRTLDLLCEGKTNRQIGLELGFSRHSIRAYVQELCALAGVEDENGWGSRTRLACWWTQKKNVHVNITAPAKPV